MTRVWWARSIGLLALVLAIWAPRSVRAHPIDSASLTLTEGQPGRFQVRFQAGSVALQRQLVAPAVFPAPCRLEGTELDCGPLGLAGSIEFPWLDGTLTRLIVSIEWRDGTRLSRVLTASTPSLAVYGVSSAGLRALLPVLVDYTTLGIEHILSGFDHLCFVLGLAILVRRRGLLLATITAFTLAHSLTLAASALGLLELPSAPVEVMIALSIVLVCADCLRPGDSLTRRAPWLVAFTFGLLHGMGFASALLEIGLPEKHLPSALFSFNLGVELGQLAVIGAVVALRALARRWRWQRAWMTPVIVYAMGSVAAFWVLDRLVAVFGT